MPTKIGINGFGRIGRLVMRAALDNPDCKLNASYLWIPLWQIFVAGMNRRARCDCSFCSNEGSFLPSLFLLLCDVEGSLW